MGDERCARQEAVDCPRHIFKERGLANVPVLDTGQLYDRPGDLLPRVKLCLKVVDDLAVLDKNAANLDNAVTVINTGTSRFQINDRIDRRGPVTLGCPPFILLLQNITGFLLFYS